MIDYGIIATIIIACIGGTYEITKYIQGKKDKIADSLVNTLKELDSKVNNSIQDFTKTLNELKTEDIKIVGKIQQDIANYKEEHNEKLNTIKIENENAHGYLFTEQAVIKAKVEGMEDNFEELKDCVKEMKKEINAISKSITDWTNKLELFFEKMNNNEKRQ